MQLKVRFLGVSISPGLLLAKLKAILRRTSTSGDSFTADNTQPGIILDDRYEVISQLGSGGMAVVFQVLDQRLNRVVALKMLSPVKPDRNATLERRFRREIEAEMEIEHPNMIRVYDVGQHKDLFYYTMDYLSGGSLLEKIKADPLPLESILSIASKMASLLSYIHSKGILHRDIKTENILFSAEGEPILTDFGLALRWYSTDTRLTQKDLVVGTPCYMSPERIVNSPNVDHRSDIFALGMLMYEMLVGYLPHSNYDLLAVYNIVKEGLTPPSEINSEIPEEVSQVCMKAISFYPKERYQSAGKMGRAVDALLAKHSTSS